MREWWYNNAATGWGRCGGAGQRDGEECPGAPAGLLIPIRP